MEGKISELQKEQIEKSEYPVVGAKYNNEYKNLDEVVSSDGKIELIDINSKEGMKIYRRTLTYIMGKAFWHIYPEAHVIVNYQLSNAMYCDIENMEVTDEMIEKVKAKMQEIINQDLKIEKKVMTRDEAEKFYKETNSPKGRLQFDLEDRQNINMYYCDEYYNYIYEIIATHTGATKVFDLQKYSKGFLLRYPSTKNVNELPEFHETKKLLWALQEYETIYKVLNVGTVYRLNKAIKENTIKYLILLSEALHEKKISQMADKIAERKGVKMVLIAGPSSSGKTTFAQRLGIQLKINGLKPVTISVDNYFVEREDTPRNEKGEYDFESIDAIDIDLFNKHLLALLNGEEVEMPEFDFHEGTKKYNGNKIKLGKDDVLVIEGIHCLNPELTRNLPDENKFKIYISALTQLNIDEHNRIPTTDGRLIRRIVRDARTRGTSAKETIRMWPSVRKGEECNIFPYQEEADVMFNSALIYELAVLKPYVEAQLFGIERECPEYLEAKRLLKFLDYFVGIGSENVPANSLLREFIGGGCFHV